MLFYLRDSANAITATGYLFAILSLYLAINGHIELATAAMLWTWFLDHWDGHVARKTNDRRQPGAADFGKSFDGFVDFIHGVLFPAIVVLLVGQASLFSLVAVTVSILAGAIRLSYFENVGLSADGRFAGLPVSYDTPVIAALLLLRPLLPDSSFGTVLAAAFIVLAILHVNTAIKVPAIRGIAVPIATLAAFATSIALTAISPSNVLALAAQ